MQKFVSIVVLSVASAALAASPAAAHAHLKRSQPAAGATIKAAPKAIVLDFSEGVVPRFSGVTLADAAGKAIETGKATNGAGPASLVVPLISALAPGAYKVTWHAVSVDSHRTQGGFGFTVAP